MNKRLKARIIEGFGTQSDFAEVARTHESVVSRVVRGRQRLSEDSQRLWAKLLGCKARELFEQEGR